MSDEEAAALLRRLAAEGDPEGRVDELEARVEQLQARMARERVNGACELLIRLGLATGHGDDMDSVVAEAELQLAEIRRGTSERLRLLELSVKNAAAAVGVPLDYAEGELPSAKWLLVAMVELHERDQKRIFDMGAEVASLKARLRAVRGAV